MKYSSAPAFRQALEDRLRSENSPQKLPRLRKMIAFERFMARLDDRWILKGGYALQLRSEKARTTQDVDLLAQEIAEDQIAEILLNALHQDTGDYFEFFIERSNLNLDVGSAIRFRVISRVAGRVFERFHIDIGYGDPIVEGVDYLTPPNYLAFAEVDSPTIPCYPVSQHIAEKLHALVRLRFTENSRVKDFVDILLFASMDTNLQADHLSAAIQAVFATRGDALPIQFDQIPLSWESKYRRFAKDLELPFTDFDEAIQATQEFLSPVLQGLDNGVWNPEEWEWQS
ncbi:MAG: nucleotidyl transferase AbiEii/AbiGii toxin family protein [Anaerolineae bacterium]|jgi:hypothetical protein|nr:nucleotidyl transferase AbiEii/AbiGii toxin family protein [Anaerolineae bacterium]MBT7017888.1 nucleotidyl transferase AbiEii/AbiGii toxin family protein [Anaerolineae bacterium]